MSSDILQNPGLVFVLDVCRNVRERGKSWGEIKEDAGKLGIAMGKSWNSQEAEKFHP